MAVWQADFEVVPPSAGLGAEFLSGVARVLSPAPSWSPDLLLFGQEDGHRVDVLSENGAIAEVTLRVDLRNPDPAFLVRLLDCLRESGCELRTESGYAVAADPQQFFDALRSSQAFQFVKDPHGFFDRLSKREGVQLVRGSGLPNSGLQQTPPSLPLGRRS
jgi:hypothetical protein